MVQGVSVDLDDFWLAAWRSYNTVPSTEFEAHVRTLGERIAHGCGPLAWPGAPRDEFISYPYGVDPGWIPPFWHHWAHVRGVGPDPFVMVVVLRPATGEKPTGLLREIDTGGIPVRFEPRPMARLYAKPKDKVRPLAGGMSVSTPTGDPGTLGGILEDANGTRFGLTCSHLLQTTQEAQQPSPADNRNAAARIGSCLDSFTLQSHIPPLNPYDPSINTIDAALIEFDDQIVSDLEVMGVGSLTGIASKSQAHPNSSVDVAGKEAGNRPLYIGAVTLVHEFDLNGTKYGYANLFELRRASRFHAVTGTLSHPVRPGDSGAWVLRAGTNGPEWLGVVVAGDGAYGYAIPAEFITDWIAKHTTVGTVDVK